MFNKLLNSQTTINSQPQLSKSVLLTPQSTTAKQNPFREVLPLKFPAKKIRKQTQQHILEESKHNPQKSCIRNFPQANISLLQPKPTKNLSSPGLFQNLKFESKVDTIKIRTYPDIGATRNQKRVFNHLRAKPDPIIFGQKLNKHNSSLEKVWTEERRHRDNGIKCEQTLKWNSKKEKRQPYAPKMNKTHTMSYKQIHGNSYQFKSIFN